MPTFLRASIFTSLTLAHFAKAASSPIFPILKNHYGVVHAKAEAKKTENSLRAGRGGSKKEHMASFPDKTRGKIREKKEAQAINMNNNDDVFAVLKIAWQNYENQKRGVQYGKKETS